jgi:regulatory protein
MATAEHAEDSNSPNANFTIISIAKRHGQKNKTVITFRENLEITLLSEILTQYPLFNGQSISENTLQELLAVSRKFEAYQKALLLLKSRPHSCSQLKFKLEKRGFAGPDVSNIIDKLKIQGYLDDAAFARAWIFSRLKKHLQGRITLRRGLLHAGVNREVANIALAEYPEEEEYEKICTFLDKNKDYPGIGVNKLVKRLQTRGFPLALIFKALKAHKLI